LEDRKADAAQGHQSSFETPVTNAATDFWDEPDNVVGIFPEYNDCSKVQDKMLTAKQTAMVLFNNDSISAVKVLYQKRLGKKLGKVQPQGKRCKVLFPESKVLAYKAKMPKNCQQFAMYTPEQQQAQTIDK
jgi:hypothetical protein